MPDTPRGSAAGWKPVTGPTVHERGENHAATYPALYECPVCAAAVPRGSTEKHDEWHKTLRDSTGPMGFLSGGRL